jgi:hypothetical protein
MPISEDVDEDEEQDVAEFDSNDVGQYLLSMNHYRMRAQIPPDFSRCCKQSKFQKSKGQIKDDWFNLES